MNDESALFTPAWLKVIGAWLATLFANFSLSGMLSVLVLAATLVYTVMQIVISYHKLKAIRKDKL